MVAKTSSLEFPPKALMRAGIAVAEVEDPKESINASADTHEIIAHFLHLGQF